jgi:hypothetical protein
MKTKNVTHQIIHLGDCMTCFILSVFYGSGMHRIIGSPFYVNKYFSLLESSMYIVFSIRLFVFLRLSFFFICSIYSFYFSRHTCILTFFCLFLCLCVCLITQCTTPRFSHSRLQLRSWCKAANWSKK